MSTAFEHLEARILQWSRDRHIIPNSTATAQLLKAISEVGELADAHAKGDLDAERDGVGDAVICLINFCELRGLRFTDCVAAAYAEIKDRRGVMIPGGTFVKDQETI